MKELLLKIWDEESQKFVSSYGNDPVGDSYINLLRSKIAEHSWDADATAFSVGVVMDTMITFNNEAERFINRHLEWEFRQRVKDSLASLDSYPSAKVADRGYKWYKDYD